jgi:hypothetical protein
MTKTNLAFTLFPPFYYYFQVVKDNKIILFMKGNKDFPQCGFSNTVTQV